MCDLHKDNVYGRPQPTVINLVEFSIDGFSLYLSKIKEKSRGVGIYVKDSLSCIECSVWDNRTFKESCWCEIV